MFFVENHFNRFKPLFLFVCLFRQSTTFDYNSYKDGKLVMRGSLDKRGWLGRSQTWESISQAEVEKLIAEANATYDIK